MVSMSSDAAEFATVFCRARPIVNVCSTLFLLRYTTEILIPFNSFGYMVYDKPLLVL